MREELQEKLFSKYPLIFRQKGLPPTQTCMCWGIDCDDGWYWLLDMLCGAIQSYLDRNKHLNIPQVEAEQVKEKFGGLRFYINGGCEEIFGFIGLAGYMSYHICERCGSTENVTQTKGRIRTLCRKCAGEKQRPGCGLHKN